MEENTNTKEVKIDLTGTGDEKVLIIREGAALPQHEPEIVNITGIIDTPARWVENRKETFEPLQAHVVVDFDKMSMELIVNENSYYADRILGGLELSPEYKKLKINSGEYFNPIDLAEVIKMNRAFFDNRDEAMKLVTTLTKFRVKINKKVEDEINRNNGNRDMVLHQMVTTNVPETFNVVVPLFKGEEKTTIEVETYFRPSDLTVTLVSANANEIIEDSKREIMKKVIDRIKKAAPDIAILEV